MANLTTTDDVLSLMASADFANMRSASKLNVADGATANSSNATLLNRANHTGTQTASTISNFASTLAGTTNVTPFTPSADHQVATKKYVDDNSGGSGDVTGPASAVDDRIATFDSTTGKLIQDGGQTVAGVLDTDNHTNGTTNKVFTATEQTKLAGIETGAEVNVVDSVNSATGDVVLDADDVSDAATTNKYTTAGDITKLAGIETAADVTDATNVDAAGATMNADTTMAGNGYFLDQDDLSGDDATKVASQQSIKAYADTKASIQIYKDFSLPAGAWRPADSDGAEPSSVADLDAMAFDASTEESIWMQFQLPEDYNGGVLRWRVDWDAVATASGTAVFGLAGVALTDSDALSTAVGTERTLTDTLITVGDLHQTANDGTGVTLDGTPVAGKFVKLELAVKTAGTIAVDVLFLNLQIQYQTKTTEPAVWS